RTSRSTGLWPSRSRTPSGGRRAGKRSVPMNRPGPGGQLPPHLATPSEMEVLQERVQQQYGAFGARPEDEEIDRRVFADSWFKPTVKIIGAVFVASLFLYFVSTPTFAGPGAWANSFRLDTAFVIVWAPLLYVTMARQRLYK